MDSSKTTLENYSLFFFDISQVFCSINQKPIKCSLENT
jgi:hypothetical protein